MNFLDNRLPALFWSKVQPCPMTGCWIWVGKMHPAGYGVRGLRKRLAHRESFVAAFGEHAPGLEIDHKCRVRCCVNPAHLEAVTHRENMLRGHTFGAANAAVTHCPKGHPYDDANTYQVKKRRGRKCRRCHRDRMRAAYQPKKGPV